MAMFGTPCAPRVQGGYTYLGLIIFVAIVAVGSASALRLGVTSQRRDAERELLDKGLAMSRALESYSAATAGGAGAAPARLEDLLRDPRFPKTVVRHLRKIEVDPMTGQAQWGLVRQPGHQGIVGVHSLSADKPLKQTDFAPVYEDFEGKDTYSQWVFSPGMEQ
jgi:type II secretory pathway pseudopilin PulG